jgi:hypothetical protein
MAFSGFNFGTTLKSVCHYPYKRQTEVLDTKNRTSVKLKRFIFCFLFVWRSFAQRFSHIFYARELNFGVDGSHIASLPPDIKYSGTVRLFRTYAFFLFFKIVWAIFRPMFLPQINFVGRLFAIMR